MDYTAFDDSALIRLIIHSRAEALAVLYDRYGRLVYSLALHTVGDQATAEEITQDVFMRVWEKADTYRAEQGKVSTWLTRIARNRAIDVLRRRGVRLDWQSLAWDEGTKNAILAKDGGPESLTEEAIEQEQVRSAVANLPDEQKQALWLAFFQGLTHTEIANLLGEPLGTVKTRIRLAMKKLRDYLVDDIPVKQ